MIEALKRIKILYELYNLIHYNQLKYQIPIYKQYGLKKSVFRSLSSKDFPIDSLVDHPWLDREDSLVGLPNKPEFLKLDKKVQSAIQNWSTNGYAVLKGFFSEEKVLEINMLLQNLMKEMRLPVKENRKIMYAVRYSEHMKSLVNTPELLGLLELLMGKSLDLFQSVNFLYGSEDPAHSDFFHMSTYPYGYLMAVWVALEDIDVGNGPLFYYPGSHKLKYVMNNNSDFGGNRFLLGVNNKKKYGEAIKSLITEYKLEPIQFTASRGDVLIWHANLLHGGSKVIDSNRTRKSMVLHYFGKGVIRYHEVSERPSLFDVFIPNREF